MQQQQLLVRKLNKEAIIPKRAHKNDAGLDLCSIDNYIIPKKDQILVKTGLSIILPKNTYGRIAPRSGLALKNKIDVMGGVIDENYRGEIGIILFNHSDIHFEVKQGDRIAQLIVQHVYYPEILEIQQWNEETERNSGGFGSSGIN